MNMLLDSSLLFNLRVEAICSCYGKKNIKKDVSVTLPDGEKICSWAIEGMTLLELKEKFSDHEIEYIYYNFL